MIGYKIYFEITMTHQMQLNTTDTNDLVLDSSCVCSDYADYEIHFSSEVTVFFYCGC